MDIVAVDLGGTHARFAIARLLGGRVTGLSDIVTLKAAEFASFQTAWRTYELRAGTALPRLAALAVAGPVTGTPLRLTNNPWSIDPACLASEVGVDQHLILNDFGAVAHAVAQSDPEQFMHVAGPEISLPKVGVVTICGPGTGLGVAQLIKAADGYKVIETEGGHIDYAPLDTVEDAMVMALRGRYSRVSVERVVAGSGIVALYDALSSVENRASSLRSEIDIWNAALDGGDPLASAALDRFCMALGSVTGNLALAQGATAVVLAGGLGYRLRHRIATSGFAARFAAKGRFQAMMSAMPVKLIIHEHPGLFGAAAAFAQKFG